MHKTRKNSRQDKMNGMRAMRMKLKQKDKKREGTLKAKQKKNCEINRQNMKVNRIKASAKQNKPREGRNQIKENEIP